MDNYDVIIIGAGIAGASAAYRLAGDRSVLLLEAEDQPGRHATGRSAAFFSETYGNEVIRALTSASRDFYTHPPEGFVETPLLEPSGALYIAREDQLVTLEEHFQTTRGLAPNIERHGPDFAIQKVPVLDGEALAGCVWEPDSQAINVHELLMGYLRGAAKKGAKVLTREKVEALTQDRDQWTVTTRQGRFSATIVINAAGSWAAEIGKLAGAMDIGLTPLRRSVCVIDPEKAEGFKGNVSEWPLVLDVDETFYFKPSGGSLWLSPADETPSPPCDAQPEDFDLAVAIDRLEKSTSIRVTRIEHKWAGLRSFVEDRTPVVGFDPNARGFFWLAAQGGYGIQTSPALSDIAAELILTEGCSSTAETAGIDLALLGPKRCQ
jgi:D-arginine dehydrogenase